MLKTLRFAPLEETHLPAILAIEKQCNTSPWSEKSFRNELDHPHGVFLVAIGDGQVVGFGGGWLVIDEFHVITLAVNPELQRNKIGQRIMVELLARAQEKGMACSTLEVRAGNEPAIKLYEKLGYQRVGTRKNYYPDNREDAAVMWLHDLAAWQLERA